MADHSTGVAAVPGGVVTLGFPGAEALRRPRENESRERRRNREDFAVITPASLRAVTGSHPSTSPGSGAVVTAVMKLTCSAISNPRRQGGDQPMSLAPEVR
ncbi:hypothetical protein GCM10023192_60170 [Amycolatopsis samaneae]